MSAEEDVQKLYRTSLQKVRGRDVTAENAAQVYGDYVNFVAALAPPPAKLLDAGCGNGWSSHLLGARGYDVVGVDLNRDSFEPEAGPSLRFEEGSVLNLPFETHSFQIVTANAVLEHVPDPARALGEMLRVLRPGGTLCIVGPNLISPVQSLRGLLRYTWENRPLRRIFLRDPAMPRHPFGDTLFENGLSFLHNSLRLIGKLCARRPRFEMRTPDTVPPFWADNDACYLCNPFDLASYLTANGCELICNGKPGRPRITVGLAAGTWIAVRKSGGTA